MQQQLSLGRAMPLAEGYFLSSDGDSEAFFGRLNKARDLSRRAVESDIHDEAKETAALWEANAAVHEAEFGNTVQAQQAANAALALAPGGRDVEIIAAIALARAGTRRGPRGLPKKLTMNFH